MSESVTAGIQLGNISANTEMFTAAQTEERISTLQAVLSGITESGWKALGDIVSGIDTFATKDELSGLSASVDDRIIESCGSAMIASGVLSGCGVEAVYYWKHATCGYLPYPHEVRLLDEEQFALCGLSGNDVTRTVQQANLFLRHIDGSGNGQTAATFVLDPYYTLCGLGVMSGFGQLSPRGKKLSGLLDDMISGGGSGGGAMPFMLPEGADICDVVSGCVGDLPDRVSGLESGFADLSGKIADLSGCCEQAGASLEALAGLLESLESAIYSLEEAVSGMYEDIGDAIVDALTSEALEAVFDDPDSDEDIKKRINKARGKVNIPPVPPLPPGGGPRPPVPLPDPKDVADVVKPDLPDKPASGLVEPLEDISGILDNPETPEVDSISEAAETAGGDSSGGEDAASSAESAAEAAGDVAGSFEGE